MGEYQEQPDADGSSASDETLRLYLLCRLGEAERLRLDERLLIDDHLAEQILLAESELTDDYLFGRLDSGDRSSFEKSFLTTESRRQKLRFSSALNDCAGLEVPSLPVYQHEKPSLRGVLAVLFGFSGPRVWAVSFAVLIMLVGLAWFVARQRRALEPVVVRHEPIPSAFPNSSPQTVASPLVSPSPPSAKEPETIPTPTEPTRPAMVASFVLLPGAVRAGGDMQRIAVPDGERDIVRFNLVLETTSDDVYRAEIATVEGPTVMVRNKLKANIKAGNAKLRIDVPAHLLRSGDYQIKLTRQKADGELESVGRYYFRALD